MHVLYFLSIFGSDKSWKHLVLPFTRMYWLLLPSKSSVSIWLNFKMFTWNFTWLLFHRNLFVPEFFYLREICNIFMQAFAIRNYRFWLVKYCTRKFTTKLRKPASALIVVKPMAPSKSAELLKLAMKSTENWMKRQWMLISVRWWDYFYVGRFSFKLD